MLNLRLDPSDVSRYPWQWSRSGWRCGPSWAEPYDHPMTDARAITDGTRTALITSATVTGSDKSGAFPVLIDAETYDSTLAAARAERDD
ncbi:hypothetical protein GCM10009639_49180 [Kitasatospora putterlickiae]|uniref:Uncharacterized protein n=2 Tax=Kitasatospora putterlickiae TaxID=221725 RepID=A0ABN1YCA8_9ACTN